MGVDASLMRQNPETALSRCGRKLYLIKIKLSDPAMPARRFPPPWSIDELEACFVVIDSAGQKLAYVYFEDEPGRRSARVRASTIPTRRASPIAAMMANMTVKNAFIGALS